MARRARRAAAIGHARRGTGPAGVRSGRLRLSGGLRGEGRARGRSSMVPTSVRTMCRRNDVAVISNATTCSSSATHRASLTSRTNTVCSVSVGVNAVKSCSPSSAAAFAFSPPRSTGRGCQSERRDSSAEGVAAVPDPVAIRARARVVAGAEALRSLLRRDTATSSGRTLLSASAAFSAGGPPVTSAETTFARACTPESVRPATARPSTLRRGAGALSAPPRPCAGRAAAPSR